MNQSNLWMFLFYLIYFIYSGIQPLTFNINVFSVFPEVL